MIFTNTEVLEAIRRSKTPYQLTLYLVAEETPTAYTAGQENKVLLANVAPTPELLPNGFAFIGTADGDAIQFVGSGLGNGDTAIVNFTYSASVEELSGEFIMNWYLKRRTALQTFAEGTKIASTEMDIELTKDDIVSFATGELQVRVTDGDIFDVAIFPVGAGSEQLTFKKTTISFVESGE